MVWVIVGYMWLFLHRPFEVWPWMGTFRVERVYMICTLIAWFTMAEKQLTENRINFAVALLAIAMTVSTVMSPYLGVMDNNEYQTWVKYLVFYGLVMTSVKTEKDLKILMTGFIICFFLYMLHSYREYLCGRFHWAMGTKRMVGVDSTMADPNTFGGSIVILLPMLLPFTYLLKKKWHYLFLIGYFLLCLRCVQLTGSRSAFMVLGLSLVVSAFVSKRRMTYVPLLCLVATILLATMSENLVNRYMTVFDSSINESANDSALGRLSGFYNGWENWSKSPIWGVGPNCHGFATGNGFLSHCLYGQIPGEIGTLGILGFLSLLTCFALNHMQIRRDMIFLKERGLEKEGRYFYLVSSGIVLSILLLLIFGAGGHNGYRFNWIWFAAFQAVTVSLMSEKVTRIRSRELYPVEMPRKPLVPLPPEHAARNVLT